MPASGSPLINARCVAVSQPGQSHRHSKAGDMSKERHEESAEALAGGFSEERQVHHLQATCENIGITNTSLLQMHQQVLLMSLCLPT